MLMDNSQQKLPLSFCCSICFLAISLLSFLAIFVIGREIGDGFESWGSGFSILLIYVFVCLPSCVISFLLGLIALHKTKLAFISIVPTGIYIGTVLFPLFSL